MGTTTNSATQQVRDALELRLSGFPLIAATASIQADTGMGELQARRNAQAQRALAVAHDKWRSARFAGLRGL